MEEGDSSARLRLSYLWHLGLTDAYPPAPRHDSEFASPDAPLGVVRNLPGRVADAARHPPVAPACAIIDLQDDPEESGIGRSRCSHSPAWWRTTAHPAAPARRSGAAAVRATPPSRSRTQPLGHARDVPDEVAPRLDAMPRPSLGHRAREAPPRTDRRRRDQRARRPHGRPRAL
jgi:hypothetical protein